MIKRKRSNIKMPLIGKIKIGEKVESGGKERPTSLDYFVASGKYKHDFDKAFGEKPSRIEIIFMSDDIDMVCNERYEIRKGSKLYGYGDGETFYLYDKASDKYKEMSAEKHIDLMGDVEKRLGSKWEEVLTLNFMIPRIKGVFGFWQITTKGKDSSIPNIMSTVKVIQEMGGTIKGIPFDLSVEKVKSQKPESKNLFPVLSLTANITAPNLELLREFINSGNQVAGFITDEKIEHLNDIKRIELNSEDKNGT